MIKLYAFRWVPDFARGHVRDLRVRWALEEAGIPYEQQLLDQGDQKSPDYLKLQPFGQVPAIEEDGATLFESGAIVLNIATSTYSPRASVGPRSVARRRPTRSTSGSIWSKAGWGSATISKAVSPPATC